MRNSMIAASAMLAIAAGANAGITTQAVTFNINGVESMDAFGDADNNVFALDLAAALGLPSGTPLEMSSVAWDLRIVTNGASWRSEARMYFDDNIAPDGVGLVLAPGSADQSPGDSVYSSGGLLDLSDAGIPNILLPDGVLRLEFYEGFDDVADTADASYQPIAQGQNSTITIGLTPTPGATAVFGLAGIAAMRRRRA